MARAPVLEIEEAAFRAWPADEVVELSGWRLRFMHGVTRRANSVWPNDWWGEPALEEHIAAVETFAEARGIAPSFQLTSAARPPGLDAVLAARGYVVDAPVVVMTREIALELGTEPGGWEATVAQRPHAEWLTVAVDRGRYADVGEVFVRLLERLGDRAGYAVARSPAGPAAVGLGVTDGTWLGIFSMSTLPEARRRGAARAILRALIAWGRERGARHTYLQVERENTPARALYAAAGFAPAYEYHYRTRAKSAV
jgi:ribosomal protein S18 acetylase RimI-like enzyme